MKNSSIMEFFCSPLALLTITVVAYWLARVIYKKYRYALLHPMIISMAVVITYLKVLGIEYERYYEANSFINFMLGVSVVALGYALYENLAQIRGNELSILISTLIGSTIGVVSVVVLTLLFGSSWEMSLSLQPKSVTMPIALELSKTAGGVTALTSMAVLITGLLGSIAGPWVLGKLKITDPVAKGLAMGASAHGFGTARAMQMGAVEGAVGGVAIGLMGVMTSVIMPLVGYSIVIPLAKYFVSFIT